jgi:hypothetical protein
MDKLFILEPIRRIRCHQKQAKSNISVFWCVEMSASLVIVHNLSPEDAIISIDSKCAFFANAEVKRVSIL